MVVVAFLMTSCATRDPLVKVEDNVEGVSIEKQESAQKGELQNVDSKRLKRKVAIGRFTNETHYGKTFLRDSDLDPLGKKASDILMSQLIETDDFIVLERPDLSKIKREQEIAKKSNIVGANALILGSITEFARSTSGKKGFLSSTKIQKARAKVELRLVDVETGHAFFSVSGSGESLTESGSIAGFGSMAKYDATLNDKAITAAISAVTNELIQKLEEKPWQTSILEVRSSKVIIAGGKRQGLKKGDVLLVMKKGKKLRSQETGFLIDLPPTQIAKVKVQSLFGSSEVNEGAITEIVSGSLSGYNIKKLIITENE